MSNFITIMEDEIYQRRAKIAYYQRNSNIAHRFEKRNTSYEFNEYYYYEYYSSPGIDFNGAKLIDCFKYFFYFIFFIVTLFLIVNMLKLVLLILSHYFFYVAIILLGYCINLLVKDYMENPSEEKALFLFSTIFVGLLRLIVIGFLFSFSIFTFLFFIMKAFWLFFTYKHY